MKKPEGLHELTVYLQADMKITKNAFRTQKIQTSHELVFVISFSSNYSSLDVIVGVIGRW